MGQALVTSESTARSIGPIHCPNPDCRMTLGYVYPNSVVVLHRKRRVIFAQPISITCERCGTTWRPEV